ncbi:MAG: DUF1549 domain-containing protein, partial [Planctomycetaceae bacterium]|nr:DUF1549 domain-containing protein [Planctomycetaceae bacterium]
MYVPSALTARTLSCSFCIALLMSLLFSVTASAEEAPLTAHEKFYLQKIRPLLEQKCLGCHGSTPDDIKGEYNMLTRESLIKGGESGEPAVIVGKPEQSPFWKAVTWKDDSLQMPPQERNRLTAAEIADLKQWISEGAVWTERELPASDSAISSKNTAIAMSTSGGQSPTWTNRTYEPEDIWAYQPIQRSPVPWQALSKKQSSQRNPIDAFIQQKLKQQQLIVSPPAEKKTLIRRATYDLTGLPPTLKQIRDFENALDQRSWSQFIKQLMESPQYGEQMTQMWIDVVRYADTSGFANDYERPNAWR